MRVQLSRRAPSVLTLARTLGPLAVGIGALRRLSRAEPSCWPGWVVAGLAFCEALDGVDGWLARRLDAETRIGAVLDAEADALTMLSLSLAVRATGAPGWVLVPGLLRYGWGVAELARGGVQLPARRARRPQAAAGAIGLILALAADSAGLSPRLRNAAAAAASLNLVVSFALDTPAFFRSPGRSRTCVAKS